jgi:hypothetical protein
MYLSRAASIVSFFGALVFGVAAAYVVNFSEEPVGVVPVVIEPASTHETSCHFRPKVSVVSAQDLRGRWTGTWGYDSDPNAYDVEIDVTRVEGNKFYGTLRQEGAEIAFEGTVDADARSIYFREIKVIKLGSFSAWSLGTNFGSFSPDGRTLNGRGKDSWEAFGWTVEKE